MRARQWPRWWACRRRCGISQQQEVQIGAEQAQQVNAQLPIVQDPDVNRYLNVLGDSIAKLTSRVGPRLALLHGQHERVQRVRAAGRIHLRQPRPRRAVRRHGPVRVGARARDRTRRAAPLGEADGADAGREHRRHARLRADERLQQPGSARPASTSPAARSSRSSAATTKRRPTRRASKNWFARASTRTACRRCSRSCSPSVSRQPAALDAWFADHPLEEDRIAATRAQIAKYQSGDHPDAFDGFARVPGFQGASPVVTGGAASPVKAKEKHLPQRTQTQRNAEENQQISWFPLRSLHLCVLCGECLFSCFIAEARRSATPASHDAPERPSPRSR